MKTRNLILTTLVSAAVTVGSGIMFSYNVITRGELRTPQAREAEELETDIFNKDYAKRKPAEYKAKSTRYVELISNEDVRKSIEEANKPGITDSLSCIGLFVGSLIVPVCWAQSKRREEWKKQNEN